MILISTSSLHFDKVTVGKSSQKTLTIFNDDIVPVTVTLNSSIPQYTLSTSSSIIDANGHIVLTVTFTPVTNISYTGTLTIINSLDSQIDLVNLLGEGVRSEIVIDPVSLSFGTIATGESKQQNITIQNISTTAELQVTNIVSSNTAFSFSPTTFNIQPSSHSILRVTFLSVTAAVFNNTLTLTNNSSNIPSVVIPVSGTVEIPIINVDVSSLNFGNVTINDTKILNVTITNNSVDDVNLNIQSISSTNTKFTTSVGAVTVAKGQSKVIPVNFIPLDSSTQNGILNIQTNAGLKTVSLTGKGIVSSNIYLPAMSIDCGNTIIGQVTNKVLKIMNKGQLDLNISSITSNNSQFTSTTTSIIYAGGYADITLTFTPVDTVAQSGTLTIVSDDPDTPSIFVSLLGQGITPVITVDSSFTFRDTNINETKSDTILIKNDGNCTLTINSFVFDNVIFSTTQTFPFTINQKSSKNINLNFKPTVIGHNSGNLTISSNDFVNPSKIVALQGNATYSKIALNPTDIDFGYSNVSIPKSMNVTIFNNGTGPLQILNVISSDSQFVPNQTTMTINAGASSILVITLTATSLGNKTAIFDLSTNDLAAPDIRLNVKSVTESPTISVSTSPITFSNVALNEERTYSLPISNTAHTQLNITANLTTTTAAQLYITTSTLNIQGGASSSLTVTFKPTAAVTYNGTLFLTTNDLANPLISIIVTGTGVVIPRIKVMQSAITFPTTPIGSSTTETLEIKNIGTADLNVTVTAYATDTYSTFSEFSSSPGSATILPSQSYFFIITLKPSTLGTQVGEIEIDSNDPNAPKTIVKLTGEASYASLKWKALALEDLIPKPIQKAAEKISNIMSIIITVLNFINGLLTTLKAFIIDLLNPLVAIIKGIQLLIKDLLNDLANSGIYYLQILPVDPRITPKSYPEIFNGTTACANDIFDYEGLDVFNSIKGGSKVFFNKIVLSLDDSGDARRPKFSNSTAAGCLVIAMDSGDIFKLVNLIVKLTKVLQLEFKARFNPPTNLTAIASNGSVSLTFTGNGGLLPNAFLIFRSETAGGELIKETTTDKLTKKETVVYRTDLNGRLVKRYNLVGVTTMQEQLAKIFKISNNEAQNMFEAAAYNMKGLIANLDRAISMQFIWEDVTVTNDKSYSYVLVSASVDIDNLSKITSNVKYSDDLLTTIAAGSDIKNNPKPALTSDVTGIYGAGDFSTEISVTPKSTFKANITGANRCRNYRCSNEIEVTEESEASSISTFLQLKNKNVIISTLVITTKKSEETVYRTILPTQYKVQEGTTGTIVIFNAGIVTTGDKIKAVYSYRQFTKSKEIQETQLINYSPNSAAFSIDQYTIQTQQKLLVKDSFVILNAVATAANKSLIIEPTIVSINETNGIIVINSNIPATFANNGNGIMKLNFSYSYYLAPDTMFRCVNTEFNSFYFDVVKCDDGTNKKCRGFDNRSCYFNAGTSCTNKGNSSRLVLQRVTDKNGQSTSTSLTSENIPFATFFDPVYCQLGITAQRCDGYSQVAPRAGYKGTPPDWTSISLGDLFPAIYALAKFIDDFLTALINSLKGMAQAIIDFISLIQKKITDLTNLLSKIKTYVDILANDFKGGGFYLLNVPPQVGGNEYLKQAITNATNGPSSDECGYTAGVVLAYGGPSASNVAKALKTLFG